jgi:hypothetical protein
MEEFMVKARCTSAVAIGLLLLFGGALAPAQAETFTWEQNAGLLSTSGTLRAGQARGADLPPFPGAGGLEFSGVQTAPPAPANTYRLVTWGCALDGDDSLLTLPTDCVNEGVTTVAAEQFPLDPGRSALRLLTFTSVQSGDLDSSLGEAGAVRIARLEHLNRVIDGEANALKAVSVAANLVISGAVPPVNSPNTVAITFLETNNLQSPCAPPNPNGSQCDDFFTFAGDFTNVEFQSGTSTFFLQFRLRAPANCPPGAVVDGTIQLYNCPDDPNTGAIDPFTIAIDFAGGRAWTPEGHDSAIEVWMFVTEEPIGGDDGCTPGYWKQSQHFGSFAAPFSPGQTMDAAFASFGGSPNFPKVKNKPDIIESQITLVEALSQGGGDTNALLRHFIAAVLNAANNNVNSKYENIQEIVDAVKAVLAGNPATLGGETFNSVNALKNALAASNEGGCPLGRDPGDI